MRHLFILNPAAGKRGTTKQLEGLLDRPVSYTHLRAHKT